MTRNGGCGSDARPALAVAGESAAEALLRRAGLTVLARRHRERCGEIDLIALDGTVVVFVEVKTRSAADGRPAEAVTPRKQRRIAQVALIWLARRGWLERDCRFDVVEVLAQPGGPPELCHRVDAFRPPSPHGATGRAGRRFR
jgi:putative endonuclease